MKKLFVALLALLCSNVWSFDLQKEIKGFLDRLDIKRDYVYKSGPYKGEINYVKLMKNITPAEKKELFGTSAEVETLNDSTIVVKFANGTTKTVVGGSDRFYYHPVMGKCETLTWLPINDKFHRKAKSMKCSNGAYIEAYDNGRQHFTIMGENVMECLDHYNDYIHNCKKALQYERGHKDEAELVILDSIYGRENFRYFGEIRLMVLDYHKNGFPKKYVNMDQTNQTWIRDEQGIFKKIVLREGDFTYETILPVNENGKMLYVTNDSINYNPRMIYILNDDMQIIDSLRKK